MKLIKKCSRSRRIEFDEATINHVGEIATNTSTGTSRVHSHYEEDSDD